MAPAIEALSIAGVAFGDGPCRDDEMFVALRDGEWDGHDEVARALDAGAPIALVCADWAERVELTPAQRERCLVVTDSVTAFRRLAAVLRRGFPFPVVAVGGSNGKTTTKEMIAALLAGGARRVTKTPETMNGWTGIPLTLTLREHTRAAPPDALVVEIGVDTLGAMEEHARLVDPDVAVITSLGAEHLAGLADVETVVAEETKLFESSTRVARIVHACDASIAEWIRRSSLRETDIIVGSERAIAGLPGCAAVLTYDIATPSASRVEVELSWRGWRSRIPIPMAGRHNGENFALAFAAGLALGREPEELAQGFATFTPPSMRCETHELANGCVLVDDAYNANPSSMNAAFALLAAPEWEARRKILVLGDMLDLGAASEEHHRSLSAPLRALVIESGAHICLFGDAMRALHHALGELGVRASHLPHDADARAFLDDPAFRLDDAVVLVKGSRGMHLETVVREIQRRSTDWTTKTVTTEADVARFHGRFTSACVTGTNGKTTTSSMIAAIVEASGEIPALVTTLGSWIGRDKVETEPSGPAFVRTLARAEKKGIRTVVVETTSHALAAGFARTWPAHVAVFTNLSRDHLDYHGTPEKYLAAKAQMFMGLDPDAAVVLNVADPASALLDEITPPGVRRLGYAARAPDPDCAAIPLALFAYPDEITIDENGTHARLAPSPLADAFGGRLDLAVVGNIHVENALAAALAAHALGVSTDAIRAGLSTFRGVPGRFEIVHRRPLVVVDYAHTPDALVRTLAVARSLVAARHGRVICVFGCGGDRDPGKRGEMGAVASTSADVVLVTSDNPRTEDPWAIADAIEAGARKGAATLRRILDRGEAIRSAVELADSGDIVVIAGKGHEKTQTVGEDELPFDDVVVAREAAAQVTARREGHRE